MELKPLELQWNLSPNFLVFKFLLAAAQDTGYMLIAQYKIMLINRLTGIKICILDDTDSRSDVHFAHLIGNTGHLNTCIGHYSSIVLPKQW